MRFWLYIYNFSPKYLHFSKIIPTFAPAHQPGCWRSYEAVWFFRRPLLSSFDNLSIMSLTSMSGVITLSLPTGSLQAWYSFTFFLSWWEKPAIYVICHSHSVCTLSLQNYNFSCTIKHLLSLFSWNALKPYSFARKFTKNHYLCYKFENIKQNFNSIIAAWTCKTSLCSWTFIPIRRDITIGEWWLSDSLLVNQM